MSVKVIELSNIGDLSKDMSPILKNSSDNLNICRICYDSQEKDLISACKCSGTLRFTHKECLKHWIIQKFPEIEGSSCEICKEKYNISFEYSKQWMCNLPDYSRVECLKKMLALLIALIVLTIITIVAYFRYVDFKRKYSVSIIVVALCFSALFANLVLMGKVYICAHVQKRIKNWDVVSK